MPFGEIVLIFVLALSAIAGVGVGTHHFEKKRKHRRELEKLRELGSENAQRLAAQAAIECWMCDQQINDPTKEIFDNGRWWHSRCYLNVLNKKV